MVLENIVYNLKAGSYIFVNVSIKKKSLENILLMLKCVTS